MTVMTVSLPPMKSGQLASEIRQARRAFEAQSANEIGPRVVGRWYQSHDGDEPYLVTEITVNPDLLTWSITIANEAELRTGVRCVRRTPWGNRDRELDTSVDLTKLYDKRSQCWKHRVVHTCPSHSAAVAARQASVFVW